MAQSKYILPEGMTPEELEALASQFLREGEQSGVIPLPKIQALQRKAEEMRRAALAEAETKL